jgi:outer membrane lipoprotein-sorting protein
LQIINSKTGEILFDTKDVKGADRKGRVKYKKGSGQSFEFDLEGDNQITIIVNGNEVNSGSYFEFKVEVKSSDKLLENIDVTSPRQRDVKETINENKENNDKDSD